MEKKEIRQYAQSYMEGTNFYDILRFLGESEGLHVYVCRKESLFGVKTGFPHFIEVSETGIVERVRDMDKIYKYISLL